MFLTFNCRTLTMIFEKVWLILTCFCFYFPIFIMASENTLIFMSSMSVYCPLTNIGIISLRQNLKKQSKLKLTEILAVMKKISTIY